LIDELPALALGVVSHLDCMADASAGPGLSDPRTARFDVVMIHEASQSDVMGLLAFYMADKAIVVGDHEQVSPSAVGQELNVVQHLIDEFLDGVPKSSRPATPGARQRVQKVSTNGSQSSNRPSESISLHPLFPLRS
jgi:hypothetical protein